MSLKSIHKLNANLEYSPCTCSDEAICTRIANIPWDWRAKLLKMHTYKFKQLQSSFEDLNWGCPAHRFCFRTGQNTRARLNVDGSIASFSEISPIYINEGEGAGGGSNVLSQLRAPSSPMYIPFGLMRQIIQAL